MSNSVYDYKGKRVQKSVERFVLITSLVVRSARSSSSLGAACPESLRAGRGFSEFGSYPLLLFSQRCNIRLRSQAPFAQSTQLGLESEDSLF